MQKLGGEQLAGLGLLGTKGRKTQGWRGRGSQETPSPPVELPVYILSGHSAFSRRLAQLPHMLLWSTPSLLLGAPTEGHCCL